MSKIWIVFLWCAAMCFGISAYRDLHILLDKYPDVTGFLFMFLALLMRIGRKLDKE